MTPQTNPSESKAIALIVNLKSKQTIVKKFLEISDRLTNGEDGSPAYDRDAQEGDIGKCQALAWVLGLKDKNGVIAKL